MSLSFSTLDRATSQRINNLNDTIHQLDSTDIYTTLHAVAEHIFSRAHKTFSKTDLISSHETSLNIFKRTEIIQGMFSDQNVNN